MLLLCSPALASSMVYWTSAGGGVVERMGLDGTGRETVLTVQEPVGLDVDDTNSKLYVAAGPSTSVLHRSELDGTGDTTLPVSMTWCADVAVDPAGGKIYWAEGVNTLKRANLDGTGTETLLSLPVRGNGLDLDLTNGKVYWGEGNGAGGDKVRRANLDGSNPEDLVTAGADGLGKPTDVKLDVAGGYMYIADNSAGEVLRADLDGNGLTTIVTGVIPAGLALDLVNGDIYISDNTGGHRIAVAPIGGGSPTTFASGVNWPSALDVFHPAQPIPEPAGLGLVGLALLAVRRRRS